MQLHPKAYRQLIARLWHFRALLPRNRAPTSQDASPLLIYIVAVLVLLLAVLEIDLHRAELQSLGLSGNPVGINPIFMSP
ncbi:hypothetical protein A5906_35105 [Bradyrhizobium sacchari]|uniref:Uncharacterized protein n=1 Tax=Bradyrhizobium sacchari TaxID=1399419 RepID=A0A560JNM4_9BRAD|nr:hypothetical protein [Bradyrhizobium sacchari]OPY98240.1 hypothetical protein A5906_35105 [Bradyrhizobium sacchari]TWB58849.1 hypothetical protein FBZ94_105125 [Bradyrhizobium sacchari]TWB72791.1 hypothetical protein FBZ95_106506 [Bradyrhizobium sacchari]